MTDHHHVPTLAELSEERRRRDAQERRAHEHPVPERREPTVPPQDFDQVDPRSVLSSSEMVTMQLHDHGEQPYVLESSTFEKLINARRNVALRLMADLDEDIERLQLEIAQRTARRNDLAHIVARADVALALEVTLRDERT